MPRYCYNEDSAALNHSSLTFLRTTNLVHTPTDLLTRMLRARPEDRASLVEVMSHPWVLRGKAGVASDRHGDAVEE